MNHAITLKTAEEMTTRFRHNRESILDPAYRGQNILPKSESFSRAELDLLLAQDDCAGLRIYYGMDEKLLLHAILVGYDSKNRDIVPTLVAGGVGGDDTIIMEKASRCPDECPPPSPLNP